MKKNIFYYLIGIILFSIFFSSCVDEKDFDFDRMTSFTLNPSVQLNKLVSEEISLNDFFNIDSIEGVVLTVESDQGRLSHNSRGSLFFLYKYFAM